VKHVNAEVGWPVNLSRLELGYLPIIGLSLEGYRCISLLGTLKL
jgi:hypothetical protein